ncbi:hypothetical protein SLA2020_443860 [Shorea laevis]
MVQPNSPFLSPNITQSHSNLLVSKHRPTAGITVNQKQPPRARLPPTAARYRYQTASTGEKAAISSPAPDVSVTSIQPVEGNHRGKALFTWQTTIGLNNLKRALIGQFPQEHVAKRSFTFTAQVFGVHSISVSSKERTKLH